LVRRQRQRQIGRQQKSVLKLPRKASSGDELYRLIAIVVRVHVRGGAAAVSRPWPVRDDAEVRRLAGRLRGVALRKGGAARKLLPSLRKDVAALAVMLGHPSCAPLPEPCVWAQRNMRHDTATAAAARERARARARERARPGAGAGAAAGAAVAAAGAAAAGAVPTRSFKEALKAAVLAEDAHRLEAVVNRLNNELRTRINAVMALDAALADALAAVPADAAALRATCGKFRAAATSLPKVDVPLIPLEPLSGLGLTVAVLMAEADAKRVFKLVRRATLLARHIARLVPSSGLDSEAVNTALAALKIPVARMKEKATDADADADSDVADADADSDSDAAAAHTSFADWCAAHPVPSVADALGDVVRVAATFQRQVAASGGAGGAAVGGGV